MGSRVDQWDSKIKSKVVWEDLYNEGRQYPHIYGELNLDAVFHTYVEENELKRMEPN
ncbi:DUF952 domain-containing protein [Paenibacillus sp. W2I17]|uniref:DUF952 domain-containing protein n=1 Tax=Paenibacillus sp. W2I17 TaxID=3042311 RepID=UPI0027D80488|nr:DUF952 domain-containing protein [Paenibacillus sp. W2I17]